MLSTRYYTLLTVFITAAMICNNAFAQTRNNYEQAYREAIEAIQSGDASLKRDAYDIIWRLCADENAPAAIRDNAHIILGNLYVNEGNRAGLETVIDYLQRNNVDGNLSDAIAKFQSMKVRIEASVPFTERICGMWVSGERDEHGCPKIVLQINFDKNTGTFVAAIDPHCAFTQHIPDNNVSTDISINSARREAAIYFGSDRRQRGNTELASSISKKSAEIAKKTNDAIASAYAERPLYAGNIVGQTVTNVLEGLIQNYAAKKAISTDWAYSATMVLEESPLIEGLAEVSISAKAVAQYSSGGRDNFRFGPTSFYLYKVRNDDRIVFSDNNGNLIKNAEGLAPDILNPLQPGYDSKGKFSVVRYNQYFYNKLYYGIFSKRLKDYETLIKAGSRTGIIKLLSSAQLLEMRMESELLAGVANAHYYNNIGVDMPLGITRLYGLFTTPKNISVLLTMGHIENHMDMAEEIDDYDSYKHYEKLWTEIKPVWGYGVEEDEAGNERIVYKGGIKDYKPDGFGTFFWKDGSYYIGDFKKGDFDGLGKTCEKDGTVIKEGKWKQGKFVKEQIVDF